MKYFLCDVLGDHIRRIRSPRYLLEVPNLVAIDLPAVLSVRIRMLIFFESRDSKRSDLMNKLSDTPSPIAYSSASPLESAMVSCVLLREVIRAPKYKAIPEVLLLEVAQPAQSKVICFECGMIFGRSVKTIGWFVPSTFVKSSFSSCGPQSGKPNLAKVLSQRTGCLA